MQPQVDPERRKNPRFAVRECFFALATSGTNTVGKVLDVSEGGLALKYANKSGSQLGVATLDVFGIGGVSYLANVSVNAVSNIELTNKVEFSTIRVWRMGVAFRKLTEAQQQTLREFIGQNKAN